MNEIETILAVDRRARAKRWLAFSGSEFLTVILLLPAFAVIVMLARAGVL